MGAVLESIEVKGVKIPVIYEKDTNLPIVSMQIVFQKSGSIEDGQLPGLAKFSAKMLNQGTKKLGNVGFAKKLEERAIHFGVNIGTETLVLEMSSLKEEFDKGLKIIKELFSDPNLTPEAFERVKTVTMGVLLRRENDYDYIASTNLKEMLFKNTPIGHRADGTKESIEKIKLDDVEKFLKDHIVLKRAIVVIGGDISKEEAQKKLSELLVSLDIGENESLGFYEASDKPEKKVVKKDTDQAYIYFGSPFYMKVDDKEYYKARVASFILGSSGFGSRMMEEVRVKRGLAYSAYSTVRVNKSHSYFSGYLQTKTDNQNDAIEVVKEVIAEFVEKGATQKELDAAKKFLLGSEPLRNETLSQRLSRAFMEYYKGKPLGYYKKELEKIEALSLEELNSFIKKHPEINILTLSIVTK
ncbi:M16 family metallopeptidase [Nitrosophilus alvini]|uniref:M16 family metallopeptidase n=1 Tax=Nitrosophilus alvini TaxID=2714855 RepID=UPI00190C202C|nr:pitrilysin family protein [Nitrosophilus alvini]